MRDKVVTFLFVGFFILIFLFPVLVEFSYVFEDMQLNPNDYARITNVDYRAVVVDEPDGPSKVVVTERLTFDVHAASASNLFWELWRDLPEEEIDGVTFRYNVKSVKQILEDGTEVIYEESPRLYWEDYDYLSSNPTLGPGKWFHSEGPYDEYNEQYECVFFYVDGLYREQVVFEIEYEIYNVALRYNDCSDLYLMMYYGNTVNYLDSFRAEVIFPNKDMPSSGNYDIFTYGTNTNEFPFTESDTKYPGYHTISFNLDKDDLQFKPYNEYIELELVAYNEDKHIFTEYASSNYYTSDDVLHEIYDEYQDHASTPLYYKSIKLFVLMAFLVITALVMLYAFMLRARMKAKHIFYNATMDFEYYRDIPSDLDPNFAAALVFSKHKAPKDDTGIYSSIMLSLARKEYIELRETYDNDIEITIKRPPVKQQRPVTQPLFGQTTQTILGQTSISGFGQVTQTPQTTPGQTNISGFGQTTQAPQTTLGQTNLSGLDQMTQTPQATPVLTTPIDTPPEPPVQTYEPLTVCEKYYYDLLIHHTIGNTITMKSFQSRISSDYYNTNSFVRNMENSIVNIGIKDGYFQKADYTQPKKQIKSSANFLLVIGILFITLVNIISYHSRLDLAFGSFFILGIGCILSSIYLKVQAKKYILFTQFGEDEYAKWRGLYNFLNSETLINERTIIELPIWEKYLVYATAFGLSEKVIKAIGIRCPETSASVVLSNGSYRSRSFHHSSRSFRSSLRSASRSSFSGGYGFGGGGRGGGGGGGGH